MLIALTVILVISSIGLIATVLLQSGTGAGLGAIGGAGEAFFGKKKGVDELCKTKCHLCCSFLLSSLGVTWVLK